MTLLSGSVETNMETRLSSPCEIPCCVRDNNTVMYEGAEEEPRALTGPGVGGGDVPGQW